MKKILTKVPPTLGLIVDVLIIADLALDLYKHFKKPKNAFSHGTNN